MNQLNRTIEQFSLRAALSISVIIALLLPLGYFVISYQYQRGVLDAHSELSAYSVSGIVRSNPVMWRYETLRLSEILERNADDGVAESRSVHDSKLEILASNNVTIPAPRITRSNSIYDAGTIVAHIEVSRSLRPLLQKSALLALLSLALSVLVFNLLYTFPVKTIRKAYLALGESEKKYRSLYESMQESEDRYRALFSQAGEGILIISLEGRILEVNESFCRMHGYSRAEMLSMNIRDLDCLGGVEEMPERTQQMLAGKTAAFEVEHFHKDGHLFSLDVSASLITYDGVSCIQSFHHDTTERKRIAKERSKLEAQLQQAQKMESVGRLAGGVAHDFNTLLTIISGYSELGLSETDPSQPVHSFLTTINNAAEKSTDLTRQLLAFASKQSIMPIVLNLNDAMSGMLKMLQRLIGEDIHIVWQPAPNLWSVKVDPSQIDQILANLCVNARDSIADVGTISIETENFLVDETCFAKHEDKILPGKFVRLTVSDNGCGMDEETQSQIFEPFFTTKGLGKGTGLGLSTVYGIVKQNNGFINVESEPGIGTIFMIYLPCHEDGNNQTLTLNRKESAPRGQETILLVEDEDVILDLGTRILSSLGYTVLQANTPGEAIQLARQHAGRIQLLLTDVVMPEMNGRDLADRLQAEYPDLKCIYMSGYTADVIAHHGVLAEGINFIQKPFSSSNMATKVRNVLDKGR